MPTNSATILLLNRITTSQTTRSPITNLRMCNPLPIINRNIIFPHSHLRTTNRNLQPWNIIPLNLCYIESDDSPVKIFHKMGDHFFRVQSAERSSNNILEQCRSERDGACNDQIVSSIVGAFGAGGVGCATKNREAADCVVFEGPGLGIWVEIA